MLRKKRFNSFKIKKWLGYVLLGLIFLSSMFNHNKSFYNYKSSEGDSQVTINYINSLRNKYNKKSIMFDKRAFELAVARAKDMSKFKYYDHTNPQNGNCPDKMKYQYGFNKSEYLAENLDGYEDYSENIFTRIELKPMTVAVDSWMNSRGHRYNLLYDKHIAGAVGCYKDKCVFLGLNSERFGSGCHTAIEGRKHWKTVSKQPGEVSLN